MLSGDGPAHRPCDPHTTDLTEAIKQATLIPDRNVPARLAFTSGRVTVKASAGDEANPTETNTKAAISALVVRMKTAGTGQASWPVPAVRFDNGREPAHRHPMVPVRNTARPLGPPTARERRSCATAPPLHICPKGEHRDEAAHPVRHRVGLATRGRCHGGRHRHRPRQPGRLNGPGTDGRGDRPDRRGDRTDAVGDGRVGNCLGDHRPQQKQGRERTPCHLNRFRTVTGMTVEKIEPVTEKEAFNIARLKDACIPVDAPLREELESRLQPSSR